MKPVLLCLGLFSLAFAVSAQTTLSGLVTDEDNEPVIFGSVALLKGGVLITATETDFDGRYYINVGPGMYQMEFTYLGLEPHRIDEVMVYKGEKNQLDVHMEFTEPTLETFIVIGCGVGYQSIYTDYVHPMHKKILDKEPKPEDKMSYSESALKFFPNPTTGQITVTLAEPVEAICLYNLNGRTLRHWSGVEAERQMINLSNYPSGTYLLEATAGGQRRAAKVIIQR